MTEEEKYIKFWIEIKNKCDEIEKEYNDLSPINKCRVDDVISSMSNAVTFMEIVNIANNQLK